MSKFKDPLKNICASLALMSDPLKEHREMMALINDPMKNLRASMELMSDPLKEHREMMASFSNKMKDLRASLSLISDPFSEIQKAITNNSFLKSIRDIAFETQPDIEIDSEGVVTLSSKRITAAELQELSDQIFQNSSLPESSPLEDSINSLFNEIRSQKDSLTQKILIYFTYPLIISVIASFINLIVDHNFKPYLNADKRSLAKELKTSVNSAIDNKDILSSLRYVSADTLSVRASASVKSKAIGYLRFSSAVLIIEKQKSWTLIEWNDPDTDAQITGWVFSRYLTKFR